jgi:REP element-mobilizing transposase RayT
MKSNSYIYGRKSLRLKSFDYSQIGAYFITICTRKRKSLFGCISDGEMRLSDMGSIVMEYWERLPHRFPCVSLDECIVMPNHLHGIIIIVGAQFIAPQNENLLRIHKVVNEGAINRAPTLGEIIRPFKAVTSRQIRVSVNQTFGWQRNYYEHVIRNEDSLNHIREYIRTNPTRWELDRENPKRKGEDIFDRWLSTFKDRPGNSFQRNSKQ